MIDNIKDDLENVSADAFGKALKRLGLNFIVRKIAHYVVFLKEVFDVQAYQVTNDLRYLCMQITYFSFTQTIHSIAILFYSCYRKIHLENQARKSSFMNPTQTYVMIVQLSGVTV